MQKQINAVIVDNNREATNTILEQFKNDEEIKILSVFDNGEDAYSYILSNHNSIDIIIMDVLLPKKDGVSLIEDLARNGIKKKIIVLSSYENSYLISKSKEFNICFYILKPFSIYSLKTRIIDAGNMKMLDGKIDGSLEMEICEILHNLGIPSHIRGYKYIRDGITMIYKSDTISMITKDIYPEIALKYDTTPSRVERAIRHAIEVSCIRGDLSLIEEIFGFSVSCEKSKPTNSEFLSTIADRIKLNNSQSIM